MRLPRWFGGKNLPVHAGVTGDTASCKDPLEKEMATHSSILVWRIPWTEEPGGLQCMGSPRVPHDGACMKEIITFRM